MTTPAAANIYLAQHQYEFEGTPYAVFNPRQKPIEELPVIMGFNNGGSPGWYSAVLISEDGIGLGGHICSHEGYMRHDLGIYEGTRPDRHKSFREHYPDGYRMTFVENPKTDEILNEAIRKNKEGATEALEKEVLS